MSPRAACRLEQLGFPEVYDYTAGKADWLAHGLETEGEQAGVLRARHAVRADVVTASIEEPVGEVRARVAASPYGFALVVAADGTVVGRLRAAALAGDPDRRAEQVMEAGPSTVRPDRSLQELVTVMRDKNLTVMLVTTPEGRPREGRRTWLAESVGDGGPGKVIVKASANPFAPTRAAWAADAMGLLGERGYPVPRLLWRGPLDADWFVVVQGRLPGQPLHTLDAATLDRLLALVELQADQAPRLGEGGWDVSWWIGVVLFEGWEHWWDATELAAPQTGRRLRAFLQPAWGHRLPATDLVHGDLNLTNVLAADGVISGVVYWDDLGVGCRTTDLAGLLFEWYRLRLAGQDGLAPDGAKRLVRRIVEIAGDQGLRCVVGYGAVARLGLSAQRNQSDALQTWRHVTEAVLDFLQ